MRNRILMLGAVIAAGLLFAAVGSVSISNIAAQPGGNMQQQGQGQGSMKASENRRCTVAKYKTLQFVFSVIDFEHIK